RRRRYQSLPVHGPIARHRRRDPAPLHRDLRHRQLARDQVAGHPGHTHLVQRGQRRLARPLGQDAPRGGDGLPVDLEGGAAVPDGATWRESKSSRSCGSSAPRGSAMAISSCTKRHAVASGKPRKSKRPADATGTSETWPSQLTTPPPVSVAEIVYGPWCSGSVVMSCSSTSTGCAVAFCVARLD